MAINIKELFSTDTDVIRLDKLNYNFDQIVANGGGPIGLQGAKGEVGPQGAKGQKGDQGIQGSKGEAGIATDYFVRQVNQTSDGYILSPIADLANHTIPPAIVLGDLVDGSSTLDNHDETPLYLKVGPYFTAAERIGTADSSQYVDILPATSGGFLDFSWNPGPLTNSVRYKFKGIQIALNIGGNDKVILGDTSTYNGNAVFNSGVKITTGAAANKYLKSDAAGNATWADLITSVPIGTIVMVPKFVLNQYVNWVGSGLAGNDYRGRGTGLWAGWYYCWGQTWGSYETPDLRERYPIGYTGTGTSGLSYSGHSIETDYAATGVASHSTSGTSGYFGTNDVDQMQSKVTADNHQHQITAGGTQLATSTTSSIYAPNTLTPYGTLNTTLAGAKVTDITPRSAVVGFMIYLGSSTLTYSDGIGPGGGPIGLTP